MVVKGLASAAKAAAKNKGSERSPMVGPQRFQTEHPCPVRRASGFDRMSLPEGRT